MRSLRTTNNNHKRAMYRTVRVAAAAYHQKRVERLAASHNLWRLADSGYRRRHRKGRLWQGS